MFNPFSDKADETSTVPPFVLELRQENVRPDGGFTPSAAVLVTDALHASRLPCQLDPEDFRTLLLVLSCITANGSFMATADALAKAVGISRQRMASRLHHLTTLNWRAGPLLFEHRTESGLVLYLPASHLFELRHIRVMDSDEPRAEQGGAVENGPFQSNREAIIAYSRAAYGRPRALVEAEIERFLHDEPEPATPEEEARLVLRRRLMRVGVTSEQADRLMEAFPSAEIEAQLEWLPLRPARNPAGLLIAAIENRYEPPSSIRQQLQAAQDVADSDLIHGVALLANQDVAILPGPGEGAAYDEKGVP